MAPACGLAAAASSLERFGWLTPSLSASSAWVNPFASRSSVRFRRTSYAFLFSSIRFRRSGSLSIFSRSFLKLCRPLTVSLLPLLAGPGARRRGVGQRNHLLVKLAPTTRLVAADEQHRHAAWIEGEEHPDGSSVPHRSVDHDPRESGPPGIRNLCARPG